MFRLFTTLVSVLVIAVLFASFVPLAHLTPALNSLVVALSVMAAAVFVRLNRGMPTLEWKNVAPETRGELTTQILKVTVEYGWIIAINALALILMVAISIIGKEAVAIWPQYIQRPLSALIGALMTLVLWRMAYVVWRDIDIVRLQKHIIDEVAENEQLAANISNAEVTTHNIKAANVRSVTIPQPKAFGE